MGPLRLLGALGRLVARIGGPIVVVTALVFLVGLVLVLFGFDLGDVDAWLDAQGSWIEAIATILFRLASGLVLLLCLFMIGSYLFDRASPDRPGLGCLFGAIVVGYFAWFGMTAAL